MDKIGYTLGGAGKIDAPWKIKRKMLKVALDEKEHEDYNRINTQIGLYIPNPGVAGPAGYDLEELATRYGEYWKKNAGYIKKEINKLDNDKYSIIITRHPIDVMRMSDFEKITSCHSPPSRGGGSQEYYKCAVAEAMGHGAIAYVVETEHLLHDTNTSNIDSAEQEIQEGELFHDDARNAVSGYLTPVSRTRLRQMRYYTDQDLAGGSYYPKRWDDGTELAVPERRIYGAAIPGLYERVAEWARENQEKAIEKMPIDGEDGEAINLDRFWIFGGSYEDTAGAEGRKALLSRLIGRPELDFTGNVHQNQETEDDLDANALSGFAGRWRNEVEEIMEEWNNRYANTHVDAEVQEDYEGGFYISVRATMQWSWDLDEFSKLPNSYPTGTYVFDSINDIWGDIFDSSSGFINNYDRKNVRIGCALNLEHPEVYGTGDYVYDPDNLRDLCAALDTKMDDKRDGFKATIEEFLKREGWMEGGEYLKLAMEIEDRDLASYEWDLETDGEYSESYESTARYSFDYDPEEWGMDIRVLFKLLDSRDYKIALRRNLLELPRKEVETEYYLQMSTQTVDSGGDARVTAIFSINADEPDIMAQLFRELVEGSMDDEDNLTVVFNKTLATLKNNMGSGVWPEEESAATANLSENLVKTWKQFINYG